MVYRRLSGDAIRLIAVRIRGMKRRKEVHHSAVGVSSLLVEIPKCKISLADTPNMRCLPAGYGISMRAAVISELQRGIKRARFSDEPGRVCQNDAILNIP